MIITPIEQLEIEVEGIEAFLVTLPPSDISLIIEHGDEVNTYIARTGKMLADAKYHKDVALRESIIYQLGKQAGCPPSVLTKLVDAACSRQNLLVNTCDRLNKAATHRLDWLRTSTSMAKEELRLQHGIGQK